jgi:hypothetical protein
MKLLKRTSVSKVQNNNNVIKTTGGNTYVCSEVILKRSVERFVMVGGRGEERGSLRYLKNGGACLDGGLAG